MRLEDKKKIVLDLIGTFQTASELSLSLRKKGLKETIKEDNTPVTNGDLEVNNLLIDKISKLTPDILIVSEETSSNKNLDNLSTFWLIDPIDGTYDYINDKDNSLAVSKVAIKSNAIFFLSFKSTFYQIFLNSIKLALITFLPTFSKFTVTFSFIIDCTWPIPQSLFLGLITLSPGS